MDKLVTLPIKGIYRNKKSRYFPEGTAHDMCDLRFKNGAWETVGRKEELTSFGLFPHTTFAFHQLGDKRAIVYHDNLDNAVKAKLFIGENVTVITLITLAPDVNQVTFAVLNNTVIINDTKSLRYAIFKHDLNEYYIIDELPEFFDVNIEKENVANTYTYTTDNTGSYSSLESIEGVAREQIVLNEELGRPYGTRCFRFAYELFDGTFVKHTPPVYRLMAKGNDLYESSADGAGNTPVYIKEYRYKSTFDVNLIKEIQQKYDGIISRICVFMDKPTFDISFNSFHPSHYEFDTPATKLDDVDLMYMVKAVRLSELHKYDGSGLKHLMTDFRDIRFIESYQHLTIDNYSAHRIVPMAQHIIYNDRILLPDTRTYLYNIINASKFQTVSNGSGTENVLYCTSFIEVHLKIDSGTHVVRSTPITMIVSSLDNDPLHLHTNFFDAPTDLVNPCRYWDMTVENNFTYPDSRATLVRFVIQPNSQLMENKAYAFSMKLLPHPTMNLAYADCSDLDTSLNRNVDENNVFRIYAIEDLITSAQNSTNTEEQLYSPLLHPPRHHEVVEINEIKDYIEDENRIQVSEMNNPFYFPAKNSYRIGQSKILAVTTINQALSEGQFGHYPIVAFTTSGIWTMNIGQGDVFISNIVPLAHDVCNNPKTVTPIKGGIFFSTNEGLKVLQGSEVLDISEPVEGFRHNPIVANSILSQVFLKDSILKLLSTVDFKEYSLNSDIGYDYYENELIVSNSNFDYSYVYSFDSKEWFKISETFDNFYNLHPHNIAIKGGAIFNLNKEIAGERTIYYISNSFSLIKEAFVKINQFILRGDFGPSKILLFASTDNKNYRLVATRSISEETLDIHMPRLSYSAKSFVFVIVSNQNTTQNIVEINALISLRYDNKIR